MASWTRVSGTAFTPARAHHFREETRKWYVRIEKPAGTLTVKVYHSLSDANAGNASFTASGSVAVGTDLAYEIALTDNAGVPPVFTLARLTVALDNVASTGNEVWTCDLGKKKDRAKLRVYRAIATKISTANGYAFDLARVELGVRQWEEALEVGLPYVGIYGGLVTAEPYEVGDGSQKSVVHIAGVGHLDNGHQEDAADARAWTLYDDIQRAILVTAREPYDGAVNDGLIFDDVILSSAEADKGISWARERATVNFLATVTIYETGAEIVAA